LLLLLLLLVLLLEEAGLGDCIEGMEGMDDSMEEEEEEWVGEGSADGSSAVAAYAARCVNK
jgi:hypothetical protein